MKDTNINTIILFVGDKSNDYYSSLKTTELQSTKIRSGAKLSFFLPLILLYRHVCTLSGRTHILPKRTSDIDTP